MIAVLAVATCVGGALYLRARDTRIQIENATRETVALRAALDHVDYGIALLDHDLRAQFLNRTFRTMWHVPDEKADRKPTFVDLMYHGRDIKAYALGPDDVEPFVSKRLALVRAGDETPIDIRVVGGQVIRFQCKVLPGGGRMLTYADVTDLVRDADEAKELATTDGLTQLFNRRHFLGLANEAWDIFQRYHRPLSVLMLDIDHFKSINDRFGHDVGDRVIVRIAEACRNDTRNTGIAARLGGEEFIVLLPETDIEEALRLAERLRDDIAAHAVETQAGPITLTVSVGVAQADDRMRSIADLLKQADLALYAAKRGGRNRVATAHSRAGQQSPRLIASR